MDQAAAALPPVSVDRVDSAVEVCGGVAGPCSRKRSTPKTYSGSSSAAAVWAGGNLEDHLVRCSHILSRKLSNVLQAACSIPVQGLHSTWGAVLVSVSISLAGTGHGGDPLTASNNKISRHPVHSGHCKPCYPSYCSFYSL